METVKRERGSWRERRNEEGKRKEKQKKKKKKELIEDDVWIDKEYPEKRNIR